MLLYKNETKDLDKYRVYLNGPRRKKTCIREFANNKGANQPAHPCSLTSAFFVRSLQSIIFKLASSEISIF